ncbi:MAG: septal ring lytic transglycosylase RlpA family protein [Betaproteobacteria bacterium]|nr:septal ring lytic transglycosylase RlpA family protein [Betaproteobacteria bacterium]
MRGVGRAVPAGLAIALLALGGCGTVAKRAEGPAIERAPSTAAPSAPVIRKGGGYYLDDGPGDNPPANLDAIPDAVPRPEPVRKANVRPYVALGKTYTPMAEPAPYKERGIASWYGRRYHGQKTASGEIYDMYAMTAAHPLLPIPSYARVTNLKNGRSVVVRVNDRGPFHSDRLIDLSYTAAWKLDVLAGGSQPVEVEAILPGQETPTQVASAPPPAAAESAAAQPASAEPAAPQRAAEESLAPAPREATAAAGPGAPPERPDLMQALAPAQDAGGIYLQLGAFSGRDNAENFLARMRAELAGLADTLAIFARDGLFRVHAGPYSTQADARRIAERIAQSLGVKPVVLVR